MSEGSPKKNYRGDDAPTLPWGKRVSERAAEVIEAVRPFTTRRRRRLERLPRARREAPEPAVYLEPAQDDLAIRVRLIRALSALLEKEASAMRTSREGLDDLDSEE